MAVVHYNHPVRQIPQPRGSKRCWAACIAMVRHSSGANTDAIVNAVVAEMRTRGVALDTDDALPEGSVAGLANVLGRQHWGRRSGDPLGVDPAVIVGALRHGAAMAFGARAPQYADGHPFHVVVLDKLNGDTEHLLQLMLHGVDPLVPAQGGGFDRSVPGFQNYMTINHLIYRAH